MQTFWIWLLLTNNLKLIWGEISAFFFSKIWVNVLNKISFERLLN